jgi:hypothetical protein
MAQTPQPSYEDARIRAREAFQRCLEGELAQAQEQLQRARTQLKRLDGDLPIARYSQGQAIVSDAPFVTYSIEQARAWGWLEMASGVYQLTQQHPGAGLVHFKRAWRIWRPWSMEASDEGRRAEARHERLRASLWLGESWARTISDRARQVADAVLRAALRELTQNEANALLQETIQQQKQLPPAPLGSPAHRDGGRCIPYVYSLITKS